MDLKALLAASHRLARRAEPSNRRRPQLGQSWYLHRQGRGRPRRSRGGRYRGVAAGDGVAFPSIPGEAHDQGGRVYEIFDGKHSVKEVAGGPVELAFGRDALDFDRLQPGQELWKTDDPQIDRRLRKTFAGGRAQRRVPLDLTVEAAVGRKLRVSVRPARERRAASSRSRNSEEAQCHPLTAEVLREQFGRLGTSVYELRGLEAGSKAGPWSR